MNLDQIRKLPYKEKKLIISESCLLYRKLRIFDEGQNVSFAGRLSDYKKLSENNLKKLSIFETIFSLLNEEERYIIENEFINENSQKYYWENRWSKSTYYKIKHNAIDNFLFLLYA